MFVTIFYGILAARHLFLSFVNAGHNPPLIFRAGSVTAEEHPGNGPAPGVAGDFEYQQPSAPLASGDLIVLYTDGIKEDMNGGQEIVGTFRLIEAAGKNADRSHRRSSRG